jgi:hypothetical protein
MQRMRETSMSIRAIMATGAAGIVLTLALQLDLMIEQVAGMGLPPAYGVVVFACFFTVWTNILIAATLLVSAVRPGATHFLGRPGLKFALAVSITVVGAVFALLLRDVYPSTGWQAVCNVVFHYVVPPLYLLYWVAVVPKGHLRWRDAWVWLAYPGIYFAWLMAQALVTGFYPYPFYDVATLGYPAVLLNGAALLLVFLFLGLGAVALDRALGRRG